LVPIRRTIRPCPSHALPADQDGPDPTVGEDDPVLDLERGAVAGGPIEGRLDRRPVVGVHEPEGRRRGRDILRADTDHPEPLGRRAARPAGQVPLPVPDPRDALRLGELPAALAQLPLGAARLGDVAGEHHHAGDRAAGAPHGHDVRRPDPGRVPPSLDVEALPLAGEGGSEGTGVPLDPLRRDQLEDGAADDLLRAPAGVADRRAGDQLEAEIPVEDEHRHAGKLLGDHPVRAGVGRERPALDPRRIQRHRALPVRSGRG
jgi:hypothetical protein